MTGVSWNVDRVPEATTNECVTDLMKRFHIGLIQECGPLLGCKGGHVVIASDASDRTPAVVVHRAFASKILKSEFGRHHAAVKLSSLDGDAVFLSMYLPDTSKSFESFAAAVSDIDNCLVSFGTHSRIIVGGDADVQLPPCDLLVGPAVSGSYANDRGNILLCLAAKWNLEWTSTFSDQTPCWTIELKNTKEHLVLDYVLSCGGSCRTKIMYDWDYNSDHRPLSCEFSIRQPTKRTRRKDFSTPVAKKYISECLGASDLALRFHTVPEFQACLGKQVQNAPTFHVNKPPQPLELKNAFAALSCADEGVESVHAARHLYRVKCRLLDTDKAHNFAKNATKIVVKQSQIQRTTDKLRCENELTEDRSKWSSEIVDNYAKQYHDHSISHGTFDPARRAALRLAQKSRLAEIRGRGNSESKFLDIPLWLMLEVRARFCGKSSSAPGADGISWDVLGCLPHEIIENLRIAFIHRLNLTDHGATRDIPNWNKSLVRLIPKPGDITNIKQWRPISLTSCLQKWYCACVSHLVDQYSAPLSDACSGFRRGHQVAEISESARHILQKSAQWNKDCVIMKCDVAKAFDSLNHNHIVTTLRFHKTPELLIHAIMEELSDCAAQFSLQEVNSHIDVLLANGGKQGGSETPGIWNRYLDWAWQAALIEFRAEGLGFSVPQEGAVADPLLGMYWADDVYLFANNVEDCKRMFQILSAKICLLDLKWKPDSLEILINFSENKCETLAWNTDIGIHMIRGVPKMNIPGTMIDRTGSYRASMDHRASLMFAVWAKTKEYFCSRRVPLIMRVRKFYETLGRGFLFGSGGWCMTYSEMLRVDKWEKSLLMQMLNRRKCEQENFEGYYRRLAEMLRQLRARCQIMPLSLQCCMMYFGWAGHVARMPSSSCIVRALEWRNLNWYRHCQGLGSDVCGGVFATMSRVGRPVRWEDNLEVECGHSWQMLCGDRAIWATRKAVGAIKLWSRCRRPVFGDHPQASFTPLSHIAGRAASLCPVFAPAGVMVLFAVDNMQVSSQINGSWGTGESSMYRASIDRARYLFHLLSTRANLSKWTGQNHCIIHRPRRFNVIADAAANLVHKVGTFHRVAKFKLMMHDRILVTSDGSFANLGSRGLRSSIACAIFVYREGCSPMMLSCIGYNVHAHSSVDSEFQALHWGIHALLDWLTYHNLDHIEPLSQCALWN